MRNLSGNGKSQRTKTVELSEKKCAPCGKRTPRIAGEAIDSYLKKISEGWYLADGKRITRKFKLKDFKQNMNFVNKIAELAEGEGHHPDLCILWNILEVSLWTHAIGGLSDNDFIMASKIDKMYHADFKEKHGHRARMVQQ